MKRQHYYSFAFCHSNGAKETKASVYIGYDRKFISLPQIIADRESAEIDKNAMMFSCCYLGKMTKEEIETGITSRSAWIRKVASSWNKLKDIVRFFYQ